ncbi:hypothetical protein J8273_8925 [Carpediemonas membranifera]|uniref:Uncharacterized protein n=1 Tax=Carpediemonas membranifera TaxID=201153 RepID=A0A8J6AXD6_9EUKA|nr:hypothetical protein J8273_8925 [Carpediemonas membranifera]|eukprot:KAG9389629.1 hypothetical protein J8273_8925 [Carpediemonas membranifera]
MERLQKANRPIPQAIADQASKITQARADILINEPLLRNGRPLVIEVTVGKSDSDSFIQKKKDQYADYNVDVIVVALTPTGSHIESAARSLVEIGQEICTITGAECFTDRRARSVLAIALMGWLLKKSFELRKAHRLLHLATSVINPPHLPPPPPTAAIQRSQRGGASAPRNG